MQMVNTEASTSNKGNIGVEERAGFGIIYDTEEGKIITEKKIYY